MTYHSKQRSGPISDEERIWMLIRVAVKLVKPGSGFEIDELVNEAWLCDHVRLTEERYKVFMAGRWAMLDYIRIEQKTHRKYRIAWRRFSEMTDEEYKTCEPRFHQSHEFEFIEELSKLIKNLSPRHKLIFNMRMGGKTFKEIGDRIEVKHQRVHQIWKKICSIIKLQYWLVYGEF